MRPELTIRAVFDQSATTSSLDKCGFARSGLTWTRVGADCVHVVDVQRSRFTDPGTVRFTINVGVAFGGVWRAYHGQELPKRVHEADCFPRYRVGEILGGFGPNVTDVWWTILDNEEPGSVGGEVKEAVIGRCIPLLDELVSIHAFARLVRERAPIRQQFPHTLISWAIVCVLTGQVEEAERTMSELESRQRLGEEWLDRMSAVRERLGMA